MTGLKQLLLAGAMVSSATPLLAEDGEWQFEGALYLFATETEIGINDLEGTLTFSDALDNLDFAAMGALIANNGKWTIYADLMYFNLGFSNGVPNPVVSSIDTDAKMLVFNAAALYRVYETQTSAYDLGAGFRHFKIDNTISVESPLPIGRSVGTDDSWTDPVISARASFDLSDKWDLRIAADYGSFINDRETYQATMTFGYDFAEDWAVRFGYRYLKIDNDSADGNEFSVKMYGPMVGVVYTF